jgi:hypothetical protein
MLQEILAGMGVGLGWSIGSEIRRQWMMWRPTKIRQSKSRPSPGPPFLAGDPKPVTGYMPRHSNVIPLPPPKEP